MLTRDERLTALITNLRHYEPKIQPYFQLESEDVPIVLSVLENLKKIEQEPTQSPIIDWNNCHTPEQLGSIATTKDDLGVYLIDRAELLKATDTWDKFGNDPNKGLILLRTPALQERYVPYVHYDDMVNCVKGMPSVTPQEPRWIPVSEGLPKELRGVLVYCPINDNIFCAYLEKGVWKIFSPEALEEIKEIVTAWMPLPKAYREVEE